MISLAQDPVFQFGFLQNNDGVLFTAFWHLMGTKGQIVIPTRKQDDQTQITPIKKSTKTNLKPKL